MGFVPHHHRHGAPRNLFTLWFGANAMGVTLLTGSLAVFSHLSLLWSAIAITIGTLVGAIFVAYHSAQGPALGLPQMVQSRAQFGYYGANVPLVAVIAMYLGFFGGGAILMGSVFAELFGGGLEWGILLGGALAVILVVFGYRTLHVVGKIITPVFIAVFALLTVIAIIHWPGVAADVSIDAGGFSTTGFFFVLGIVAAYMITYGPYVADYSRYLPADTKAAPTFWYTYAGISLAGIWIFVVGAALQYAYSSLGIVEAVATMAGTAGPVVRVLVLLALLLGLINISALNIYGASISAMTITTTLRAEHSAPSRSLRLAFMTAIGILGTAGAVFLSEDLVLAYENFVFFLIAFLIPWSAINLVDFYLVRKGHYSVADLFTPRGRYGGVSWIGIGAYLIGCLALTPFISTTFYTGPLATRLGFDISWLVGMIVPGAIYAVLWKITGLPIEADHPDRADTAIASTVDDNHVPEVA
ncbi:purine-cytosine permease family protein [Mycolicibacterium canariasense]|uniref:purine-cytosine permease family protein n=1 Tax=Mycolicibacterium canariasense TaxID=228230 RepID=UPI0013F4CA65|nr:cytosine permease [Mycolicibacterium canariasense]MCV7210312.1 cytosine permease [Mycolicibacterium canariasense]